MKKKHVKNKSKVKNIQLKKRHPNIKFHSLLKFKPVYITRSGVVQSYFFSKDNTIVDKLKKRDVCALHLQYYY